MHGEHQVPIWYFIGWLLLVYGVLIFGSGLYHLFVPLKTPVALSYLHADVWWGALLVAIGGFYTIRFNPRKSRG